MLQKKKNYIIGKVLLKDVTKFLMQSSTITITCKYRI